MLVAFLWLNAQYAYRGPVPPNQAGTLAAQGWEVYRAENQGRALYLKRHLLRLSAFDSPPANQHPQHVTGRSHGLLENANALADGG